MPPKKTRKVSKKELSALRKEKGKLGSVQRGKGVGSRQKFVLPARWNEDVVEDSGGNKKLNYTSPGKTIYRTQKKVEQELLSRDLKHCLVDPPSSSSSEEAVNTDSDFVISDDENPVVRTVSTVNGVNVEPRLFVCESSQIVSFVNQINETSKCGTPHCEGILVITEVCPNGLGGSLNAKLVCSQCSVRQVNFQGSALVEGSKRTVVGLALVVAFFITGHGFSTFDKTLKQYLGISCISHNRFYEIIKLINPHITEILDEMCDEEKQRMKDIEDTVLGSWNRAVVTSDGVWQTRGYFSKNGSFIIKNYLTGGLLWYGHKCMRGNDDVFEDELFEGTSKSMEGILASECYEEAKEEGCEVEVVWQDADSSSANAVTEHHPNAKVYKCGGHVGRAHTNNLKEAAKRKSFSATMVDKYKNKFPEIVNAKCGCKRHKKGCGCLSDAFIKSARINHFCCLQQCMEPNEYARRMRALSQHHCRNIHVWDEGKEKCGFHTEKQCACKKCDEDENLECEGVPYETKNVLKCDYHWLEYKIECEKRAAAADSVIHPEMGRGQSNLCEAHFNVLPQFRSKSQSLCRLHYITSTNCGLCQGNMTWCYNVKGSQYSWVIDLYERLNLPVVPTVVKALQAAVAVRKKHLDSKKTDEAKRKRIMFKVARAEDQEARRKWVKRQAVVHTYGNDDESSDDDDDDNNTVDGASTPVTDVTVISGRQCRCGSTEHRRTSHSSCPLNKKRN